MSLKLQTDAYRMNKNVKILYLAVTNLTPVRTGTLISLNSNYKNATDECKLIITFNVFEGYRLVEKGLDSAPIKLY